MVTKDFPYYVCGAQQDNSTLCIVMDLSNIIILLAVISLNTHQIWMLVVKALYLQNSTDQQDSKETYKYIEIFSGEPASVLPERWQWTFPIIFSPLKPNRLYTSSQHVWVSENDGQSFKISTLLMLILKHWKNRGSYNK